MSVSQGGQHTQIELPPSPSRSRECKQWCCPAPLAAAGGPPWLPDSSSLFHLLCRSCALSPSCPTEVSALCIKAYLSLLMGPLSSGLPMLLSSCISLRLLSIAFSLTPSKLQSPSPITFCFTPWNCILHNTEHCTVIFHYWSIFLLIFSHSRIKYQVSEVRGFGLFLALFRAPGKGSDTVWTPSRLNRGRMWRWYG